VKSYRMKLAVVVFHDDRLSTIEYFDADTEGIRKALEMKKILEQDGRQVLVVNAYLPD